MEISDFCRITNFLTIPNGKDNLLQSIVQYILYNINYHSNEHLWRNTIIDYSASVSHH